MLSITKKNNKEDIAFENKREFLSIIKDLIENPSVQQMKLFRQHYNSSCYKHCLEVAYWSYLICKKLNLDYVSAARGGLLHDLFLYNWRGSGKELNLDGLHAFVHPKIALQNSTKLFCLNDLEKDIIVKHMWPVTFFAFPKYKESYIITLTDKYSAIKSSFDYYSSLFKRNKLYKYSYIFLEGLTLRLF